MTYNLSRELKVAKDLAIRASAVIMEVYDGDFTVDIKSDESPLTEADRRSDTLIVEGLRKAFPDHAVLSEEGKDDRSRLQNPWCWIVDPLDGTKEFVKRNGEFTVNIALAHHGRAVLGIIAVPATGGLYFAAKGEGAFHCPSFDVDPRPIHATTKTADLILAVSRSHVTDHEQRIIEEQDVADVIRSGSSIKGCLVARGDADIYYRFGPTMEWDTAAMQIICEEAGATFRQMDHSEMTYNREDSFNSKGFYIVNRGENIFI